MPRVVHFEIHADDPSRAVQFYQSVFGWEFTKWAGPMEYWLIKTGEGHGIDGGLMKRMGPPPIEGQAVNAYACTVEVPDIDEYAGRLEHAGGTICVQKMSIPGVGWLLYAVDTEGNIFGIMENNPSVQ